MIWQNLINIWLTGTLFFMACSYVAFKLGLVDVEEGEYTTIGSWIVITLICMSWIVTIPLFLIGIGIQSIVEYLDASAMTGGNS